MIGQRVPFSLNVRHDSHGRSGPGRPLLEVRLARDDLVRQRDQPLGEVLSVRLLPAAEAAAFTPGLQPVAGRRVIGRPRQQLFVRATPYFRMGVALMEGFEQLLERRYRGPVADPAVVVPRQLDVRGRRVAEALGEQRARAPAAVAEEADDRAVHVEVQPALGGGEADVHYPVAVPRDAELQGVAPREASVDHRPEEPAHLA